MDKKYLSSAELETFVKPIYEMQVSKAWRKYGSVIFIEFGNLVRGEGRDLGEYSLILESGKWTMSKNEENLDSWDDEFEIIDEKVRVVEGSKMVKMEYLSETKEMRIEFDNGAVFLCESDDEYFIQIVKNGEDRITISCEASGAVYEEEEEMRLN